MVFLLFAVIVVFMSIAPYHYLKTWFRLSKTGIRTAANVIRFKQDRIEHTIRVRYTYDGTLMQSDTPYTGTPFVTKEGKTTEIFVNPDNPKECILCTPLPLIYYAVGCLLLIAAEVYFIADYEGRI